MRSAISFYAIKVCTSGVYYLATIVLLVTDPKAGQYLSFFEFHRPIAGTLDLFSTQTKSVQYREYWQIVKNIFLILVALAFILLTSDILLSSLFLIYVSVFSLGSKCAVMVVRSDEIKFSLRFYRLRTYESTILKLKKFKSQLILILSTTIASVSYSYFYLTINDPNTLLVLRILDGVGFALSYIYQKYLIRGATLTNIIILQIIIAAVTSITAAFYFTGIILAVFVGLRLASGFVCARLFGYGQNIAITKMTVIACLGYWIFHINGNNNFSFLVVIIFEVVALSLGLKILHKQMNIKNLKFKNKRV